MTDLEQTRTAARRNDSVLVDSVDRYFAHDHRVVQITMNAPPPPRFEPVDVLAHPRAADALRGLAERLRSAGWDNIPDGRPLFELARGVSVDHDPTIQALGPELFEAATASGVLMASGVRWKLGFGVLSMDGLLAPVPREAPTPDLIYLGPEALYLEDLRRALGLSQGGSCGYLGSGAGHLAVVLARSYSRLWATDLMPRAAAMTTIAFALNRSVLPDALTAAVVSDVAHGLRPDSFDLVVANPPWVPTNAGAPGAPGESGESRRIFADGGPTGCELPLRFLHEGLNKLRIGGVAIMCTLDPTMTDGRRPLAVAIESLNDISHVAADGWPADVAYLATTFATPMRTRRPDFSSELVSRHPQLASAEHVAVVVAKVDPTDGAARTAWTDRVAAAQTTLVDAGWPKI